MLSSITLIVHPNRKPPYELLGAMLVIKAASESRVIALNPSDVTRLRRALRNANETGSTTVITGDNLV